MAEPADVARDHLGDPSDRERRRESIVRSQLLRDDGAGVLKAALAPLWKDAEARSRVESYADFTDCQGLFKRVVGELARVVYSQPPTRTIDPAEAQEAFSALRLESRLDARMDLALRAMLAAADACLFTRYVERLKRVVISVLEAHQFTIVPHPDDPSIAAAYIYDRNVRGKVWHTFWDDTITFDLDEKDKMVGEPRVHGVPVLPFTPLHLGERCGSFFEPTLGRDLARGDLQCRLLNLLALRKLRAQGFSQRVLKGDIGAVPKDQILDVENALIVPTDCDISTLNDVGDAANYLALLDAVKVDVAANRGISRARLNRDKAESSDDTGLLETRAELVRIMAEVEGEHFEVLKAVSLEHPEYVVPPDATMTCDFGEWEARTDRKTELEIFDSEERIGIANVLDMIAAKNPECDTEEKQWAEFERNVEIRSRKVEKLRALNMTASGAPDMPGQDPWQNGALGPPVRDGMMTRDEAGKRARGDSDPDAKA